MTYCVGLKLEHALVFMSDTRTNAGIDNISTYKKMKHWERPGERSITIMSAGNLATTQAVISILEEGVRAGDDKNPGIMSANSMFQIARHIGGILRDEIKFVSTEGPSADSFGASLIVGGQIAGEPPRMFLVYSEGNFIEAGDDTPFFQIGETKYGRPILVRAFDPKMSVERAIKLLMVSFDSTLKANLSVGLPFDVAVLPAGAMELSHNFRITGEDDYYRTVSEGWSDALRAAFDSLPDYAMPGE